MAEKYGKDLNIIFRFVYGLNMQVPHLCGSLTLLLKCAWKDAVFGLLYKELKQNNLVLL